MYSIKNANEYNQNFREFNKGAAFNQLNLAESVISENGESIVNDSILLSALKFKKEKSEKSLLSIKVPQSSPIITFRCQNCSERT